MPPLSFLTPAIVAILIIVAVVFVIKSLVKFAITAAAVAVIILGLWYFKLLPFASLSP